MIIKQKHSIPTPTACDHVLYDPIRKKLINSTPEETVRQDVISYLLNVINVPADMIAVEVRLSEYGIKTNTRADIVIDAPEGEGYVYPVAVIECKAPYIPIDDRALDQARGYCDKLGCDYVAVTNGSYSQCFFRDKKSGEYTRIKELPDYENMLKKAYFREEPDEVFERTSFEEEQAYVPEYLKSYERYYDDEISGSTPLKLALPVYNLRGCLYDETAKMPPGDYGLFELVEDLGLSNRSYGNAAGGRFNGFYRLLLVEVDGNPELFSIGISTYCKSSWDSSEKEPQTVINIGHEKSGKAHHALQLVVENSLEVSGDRVRFWHSGRIAVGAGGSGKIADLKELIMEESPDMIRNNRFYLGELHNNRLFRMDDPEVIELICSLIYYAIFRDRYREKRKQELSDRNRAG